MITASRPLLWCSPPFVFLLLVIGTTQILLYFYRECIFGFSFTHESFCGSLLDGSRHPREHSDDAENDIGGGIKEDFT